jgi:hypothetical protein
MNINIYKVNSEFYNAIIGIKMLIKLIQGYTKILIHLQKLCNKNIEIY